MNGQIDDWDALPIMLTVNDAARVLRIGRSKAYELTALYTSSGGRQGLPCLRLGDLVRVPKAALYEFVATGRIIQLVPQPNEHASVPRKPARKSRANERTQLSLLGSD